MESTFRNDEILYRAVYPPEIRAMFWKKNGSVTSAAFKDKNGLSVERGYYRNDSVVIESMVKYFKGTVVAINVGDCREVDAYILYLPTQRSSFHSEVHGSHERIILSNSQCIHLARVAKIIGILPT